MIFGRVRITARAVETHRDTYVLSHLTVVSVRRPLLGTGLLFALGGTGFGVSFGDLLYPEEQTALAGMVIACAWLGIVLGQIQLLSRDLRGSELSGMVWGTYGHLNRVRRAIFTALNRETGERAS